MTEMHPIDVSFIDYLRNYHHPWWIQYDSMSLPKACGGDAATAEATPICR